MKRALGSLLAFALGVTGASVAYSQDAGEILTRVSEAYVNLKTYDFNIESHAVFEVGGVKYRMTMPQEMAQGDTPDERMSVLFKLPTFVKLDGSDQPVNPGISFTTPNPGFYDFARITQNLQYEKFLREETLESNGVTSACWVVEILAYVRCVGFETADSSFDTSPSVVYSRCTDGPVHRENSVQNAFEKDLRSDENNATRQPEGSRGFKDGVFQKSKIPV